MQLKNRRCNCFLTHLRKVTCCSFRITSVLLSSLNPAARRIQRTTVCCIDIITWAQSLPSHKCLKHRQRRTSHQQIFILSLDISNTFQLVIDFWRNHSVFTRWVSASGTAFKNRTGWRSLKRTHVEVKVQEGGQRSRRGVRELQQERLQVELQLLLPPLHQTLWVLPQHLFWRKQPSVHFLLRRQLQRKHRAERNIQLRSKKCQKLSQRSFSNLIILHFKYQRAKWSV